MFHVLEHLHEGREPVGAALTSLTTPIPIATTALSEEKKVPASSYQ